MYGGGSNLLGGRVKKTVWWGCGLEWGSNLLRGRV